MLDRLIGRARRKRIEAAEELTARLAEKASIVVDDRLVADLGVGRKTLYRIIYDMVRRERMFMLADKYDQILLMTNTEFNRFMFRRSGRKIPAHAAAGLEDSELVLEGTPGDPADLALEEDWEIPAAALDSALAGNLSPSMYSLPENLGVGGGKGARGREPSAAAGAKRAAGAEGASDEYGWFSLDVAPSGLETGDAGAEAPNLPSGRQSLPERKRDPWASYEDAEREG